MRNSLILGLLATCFITPSAQAEELTASSWEGFYTGLQAGYGSLNGKDNLGSSSTLESGVFGAFAGYDHSYGNLVVGLGLEGNFTNYRALSASGNSRSTSKWVGAGTVRLGYAIDRFLPYLSAGVGIGEYSVKRLANGETTSNTHVGLVVGAGLEAKLINNLSARIDYKHFEMGKQTYQFSGFSSFDVEGREDTVLLGLAYRF